MDVFNTVFSEVFTGKYPCTLQMPELTKKSQAPQENHAGSCTFTASEPWPLIVLKLLDLGSPKSSKIATLRRLKLPFVSTPR